MSIFSRGLVSHLQEQSISTLDCSESLFDDLGRFGRSPLFSVVNINCRDAITRAYLPKVEYGPCQDDCSFVCAPSLSFPTLSSALPSFSVSPFAGTATCSAGLANGSDISEEDGHGASCPRDGARRAGAGPDGVHERSYPRGTAQYEEEEKEQQAEGEGGVRHRTMVSRKFFVGQWLDVKDTVNNWLEATVMDIADHG